jgi:hypothetical protein
MLDALFKGRVNKGEENEGIWLMDFIYLQDS